MALASDVVKASEKVVEPAPAIDLDPEPILNWVREAGGLIGRTKKGTPRVADINRELKALRADPEKARLLDTKLEIEGTNETETLESWVKDYFTGLDSEMEHLPGAVQDALGVRASEKAAADEISKLPETTQVDEAIDSTMSGPELTGPQQAAVQGGQRFMELMREAPKTEAPKIEVPSFDEWVEGMARSAPDAPAATVGRKTLAHKDIPAFLKQGKKDSKAYGEVVEQLQVGYDEWVPKFKRNALKNQPKAKRAPKVDPITRFQQVIHTEDGGAALEAAIGGRELAALRATKSRDQLATVLTELTKVIDRQLDLSTISKESAKFATTREYLRRVGITFDETLPDAIPVSNDLPMSPAEALSKMGSSDRLDAAQQGVADDLVRVLGADVFQRGELLGGKRPYQSKSGAARTHKKPGEGYAVYERILNGPRIANLSQAAITRLRKTVMEMKNYRGKPLSPGPQQAEKMRELYLADAKLRDRLLMNEGFMTFLGKSDNGLPLTDSQLREILHKHALGAVGADELALLYNVTTAIPQGVFYEAVASLMNGASRKELREVLTQTTTTYSKESFKNPLVSGGAFGYNPNAKNPSFGKFELPGATLSPGKKVGNYQQMSGKALTELALNLLYRAKDDLIEMRNRNAANAFARVEAETARLTEDGLGHLDELISNPTRMAEAIRAVASTDDFVEKLARVQGATSDAETVARQNVRASVPVEDRIASEGSAKVADSQKRAAKTEAAKPHAQAKHNKLADESDDNVDAAIEEARAKAPEDRSPTEQQLVNLSDEMTISEKASARIDDSIDHVASPVRFSLLDKAADAFTANHGSKRTYRFLHSAETASGLRRTATFRELQQLVARHGGQIKGGQSTLRSTNIDAAWRALQAGAKQVDDPAVNAALQDLDMFMSKYFDTSKQESILGNVYFRTAGSIEHINDELKNVGAVLRNGEQIQFSIPKEGGLDRVAEEWRTWDVKDPAELLLKLYAASERVSTKAIVGQDLRRFASSSGLYSSEAKAGFSHPEGGLLMSMLDQSGYYSKEMLSEVRHLEKFMDASRSFNGEAGKFVHGFFDPIQQSWKFGMTVVRPGHHIRNLIGDASMTYLAEGMKHAGKSNRDAIKVLATMRNNYDGVDFNRMLEGMQVREIPGSSEVISKGRYGDLSIQQVYEAAYKRGLMNSYRHSEDVLDEGLAPGGFARFMDRVSLRGGNVERLAGGVSEARDHYARLQHFMQYLHKAQDGSYPKFKGGVEELFDNAAHQVKKFHPDGSMLTPFEAKYMRRMIPFYSWLRGAIPALVEALVLHPARVQVFPKASYNLAVSMGLNPDSLTNPFPDDQLFPSFLTDQVFGPQFANVAGEYLGVNPGIASVDVANQFLAGSNPLESTARGVLGATTPLVRVPLELMAGGTWGTGARINDASDYIDASIPGVNYAANISGNSVTGSLASALQGRGFDPQLQVARGNKDADDQALSAFNWLTGLGVQNMSRPNFINYAEIEKRDQAASDSGQSRGF